MNEYNINTSNASVCLKKMHEYFSTIDINTQATVMLPSKVEYGSENHYRYLFYSCLLNYGMKSSLLHKNLITLYEQMPFLFSPEYIYKNYDGDYNSLAEVLRSYVHVRYPNQCAKNWFFLSEILHTQYHDNPKALFADGNTYHDFQTAIFKLKGFGQKTGGLLLRILIDNNLLSPIDGIAEIPIDRHDIDLCIWLGVIFNITADEVKKNKKVIKLLSDTWVTVSKNLSISPSLADQYLWIIGSQFCAKKKCNICPLHNECIRNKDGNENEKTLYCESDVLSVRTGI